MISSSFLPIFQILFIFIETHLFFGNDFSGDLLIPFISFNFRLEFFPYIWMILNPPAFLYLLNCQFLNLWKHFKFFKSRMKLNEIMYDTLEPAMWEHKSALCLYNMLHWL